MHPQHINLKIKKLFSRYLYIIYSQPNFYFCEAFTGVQIKHDYFVLAVIETICFDISLSFNIISCFIVAEELVSSSVLDL